MAIGSEDMQLAKASLQFQFCMATGERFRTDRDAVAALEVVQDAQPRDPGLAYFALAVIEDFVGGGWRHAIFGRIVRGGHLAPHRLCSKGTAGTTAPSANAQTNWLEGFAEFGARGAFRGTFYHTRTLVRLYSVLLRKFTDRWLE